MTESAPKHGFPWFIVTIALVAGYFLSSGPAVWLASREIVDVPTVERIYAPIVWAAENSKSCEKVIEVWIELWAADR